MTAANHPGVVVGLREIYALLSEVRDNLSQVRSDLARLSDRVTEADRRHAEHAEREQRRGEDHEMRLRALERRIWALSGAPAPVAASRGPPHGAVHARRALRVAGPPRLPGQTAAPGRCGPG